jgi:endonuclease/exonuclease/phosphatase family metal-dependent hydrolase
MLRILARLAGALERRILGVSAAEIRYTFEDVRKELRATRAELKAEIAAVRADVERLQEVASAREADPLLEAGGAAPARRREPTGPVP